MIVFNLYLITQFFVENLKLVNLPIGVHLLFLVPLILLSIPSHNFRYIDKSFIPLISFILYSLLSILIAPDKIEGMQRNISILTLFLFLIFIFYQNVNRDNFNKTIKLLKYTGTAFIIISLIFIDNFYDYKGEFIGIVKNKHNVSMLLSFYMIIIIASLSTSPKFSNFVFFIPIIICAAYLLINTYSRIGYFILIIYFLVQGLFLTIRLKKQYIFLIFFILVFTSSFIIDTLKVVFSLEYFVYLFERGFSGRDVINSVLINYVFENPLNFIVGCGAGCLEITGAKILDGHNGRDASSIVGIIFEYGLIGLCMIISYITIYLCAVYKYLIKLNNTDYVVLIPIPLILIPSETILINFNSFITIITFTLMTYTIKLSKTTRL